MFCKNCGKEMNDTAKFCPSCGTPVEAVNEAAKQEQNDGLDEYYGTSGMEDAKNDAPKKPKKGFITAIVVIAAIVVASVICAVIFIFGKTDLDRLQDAARKTETALAERTDITKYAVGYLKADQVGATVKIDDFSEVVSALYPDAGYLAGLISGSAEASAAIDRKGGASAYFDIDVMGVTAKGGYYKTDSGESDIVLDLPLLLSDPYGISLDTLQEDFENSVFNPDSSSNFSLSESDYTEFENILCIIQEVTNYITLEDINELATLIEDSKETKLDFKPVKTSLYIDDEEITVDAYTASITSAMIRDIVKFSANWLEDKVDLSKYGVFVSEIINEIAEEIAELFLKVNVELDVYNGYLVRISVYEENYDVSMEMVLGSDPSKTDHVSCVITYEGTDIITADLNLENAADNDFTLELYNQYDDCIFISASYDKDNSKFVISIDSDDYLDYILLQGDMIISDTSMSVSNITFYYGSDMEIPLTGLSAELTTKPTIRKLSEDFPNGYTNILTLDEDVIYTLSETIRENLYSLIKLIG